MSPDLQNPSGGADTNRPSQAEPSWRPKSSARTRYRMWLPGLLFGLLMVLSAGPVQARVGEEISPPAGFGYGVNVDPDGRLVESSLDLAAQLGLGWVALPLDWSRTQPRAGDVPNLGPLAGLLDRAGALQIHVQLSIERAPAWAMRETGPDPVKTADLILWLGERYPAIRALELFPPANSAQGWGTAPNPSAYLELLRHAHRRIQDHHLPLTVLAGGLQPGADAGEGAADDLIFLESLYALGGARWMPIVSVRLEDVHGAPMDSPFGIESSVLRRYELVRQVMLANEHQSGMIWVTSFSWPSGKIASQEAQETGTAGQAAWLHEAYNLLSAQLYIGAAFFQGLNPTGGKFAADEAPSSLILPTGNLHPGLDNLRRLAASEQIPGALSQISFKKFRSLKHRFKPDP